MQLGQITPKTPPASSVDTPPLLRQRAAFHPGIWAPTAHASQLCGVIHPLASPVEIGRFLASAPPTAR
jgi:hypothetical protein